MEWLILPLSFPFMQQALAITVLVAAATGALSCLLVLKGWALMGDAIAHAILPGVVLAYLAGVPLILGAFVAGLTCAVATGFVAENSRVKPDTVMGVVFAGMFGVGIVLYTAIQTEVHLDHILFGNILGVTWTDVAQTAVLAVPVFAGLMIFRRDLMVAAFDPAHARAIGLRMRRLHYGLLGVIALAVVAALDAVGLILAIGFLIGPGATAFLLTKRFERMLWASIAIAVLASSAGIILSFHIGSAPAPTISVILTGLFLLAFGATLAKAHRTATRPSSG